MTHHKIYLLKHNSLQLKHNGRTIKSFGGKIRGLGIEKMSDDTKQELIEKINAHTTEPNKYVKDVQRKRPIKLLL